MDDLHIGDLSLVTLTLEDVMHCARLSDDAGWNQTVEDWRFHLRTGTGIGLKTIDGRITATGLILPAGEDIGWIAMVLVDRAWRQRGLGRWIMETLVTDSSFPDLALDATELGRGLYDSLGFRPLEEIARYRLNRGKDGPVHMERRVAQGRVPFSGIAGMLADRSDVSTIEFGSACGLARPGRVALHVGPLVSRSETDAEALLTSVLGQTTGNVFVDVPIRAGTFCRRLERLGFEASRAFIRMSRGRAFHAEPGTFAIAGPEYG